MNFSCSTLRNSTDIEKLVSFHSLSKDILDLPFASLKNLPVIASHRLMLKDSASDVHVASIDREYVYTLEFI